MCTASWMHSGQDLVLFFNRDELRERGIAEHPRKIDMGLGRSCVYPIDPDGGGTWIGINGDGVAFGLLNYYDESWSPDSREYESRGRIIPRLLEERTREDALEVFHTLSLVRYRPFSLLALSTSGVVVLRWDGSEVSEVTQARPFISSSGYLPKEIVSHRERLFDRWVEQHGMTESSLHALHRHHDEDHPEQGIRMERWDAHTVSFTKIRLTPDGALLLYSIDGLNIADQFELS